MRSPFALRPVAVSVLAAVVALEDAILPAHAGFVSPPVRVPLVNAPGTGDPQFMGLFRRIVTARGAEIDDSRTGYHLIKPVGMTDTFPANAPEVYVVIELLQSTFDIFRLVARFILEDPDGQPVGTLLYIDKAQFENEDTGGYLLMKQPPGGFPIGTYRVEIHYENVNEMSLLILARFNVVASVGTTSSQTP